MGGKLENFNEAKAALLFGNQLLVFLRDNKPGLRFANMWDFPGGGREGEETPFECLRREVTEEFGILIREENVLWQKEHPAMYDPVQTAYFYVVRLSQEDVDSIVFGNEGQEWKLMDVNEFLKREDVVPALKGRLQDYLDRVK